jgi:hypothetical protein
MLGNSNSINQISGFIFSLKNCQLEQKSCPKIFAKALVKGSFNNEILILKKIEMITTYYPNFKNTHNLKDVKF